MLVNTVVSRLPHSRVYVVILELIQERNHMVVNNVVSHLAYRGI